MIRRLNQQYSSKISFFAFQDIITSVTGILILVTLILTLHVGEAALDLVKEEPAVAAAGALERRLQELQKQLVQMSSELPADQIRSQIQALRRQIIERERELQEVRQAQQKVLAGAERLGVPRLQKEVAEVQVELQAREREMEQLQRELEQSRMTAERLADQQSEAADERALLWLIPDQEEPGKRPLLVIVSERGLALERFGDPAARREIPKEETVERFAALLNELDTQQDHLVFYVRPSGIPLFQQLREAARNAAFEIGYDAIEEETEIVLSGQVGGGERP